MAGPGSNSNPRLLAYRGDARKVLRDKLKAEKAIESLEMVDKIVSESWKGLEAAQVGALKLLADNAWRKLAKVLPDVKSVEHDIGENTEQLTRDLLNERLAQLHASSHRRLNGLGSDGSATDPDGTATSH